MPQSVPPAISLILSLVAGYMDSCTFLALFGLFVAQVTGSFVQFGAKLVDRGPGVLAKLIGILIFLLAAVSTTVLARRAERRQLHALPAALALEAALLAGLWAAWIFGRPFVDPASPAVIAASLLGLAAMGIQSAAVRLLAQGAASTNVMTSNITQFAIDMTDFTLAFRLQRKAPGDAEARSGYVEIRRRLGRVCTVLLGFLAGTIVGAYAYVRFDLWCVLPAIAVMAALSAWAALSKELRHRPRD
jgi:uncharacterized membrane protein YoaK (UPF0700 family)